MGEVGRHLAATLSLEGHSVRAVDRSAVALGLASNGGIVEVLTSDEGGTLTIIITMPNGVSCMVAAGEYWEGLAPIVKGAGA